ncbi:DUF2637 domain-containing protein [Nocardia salmonicida]|uniref:DUF2637 domain-containing protein n=1 Tax=Nocardia salmonicida TaxID=53431 RepID=UPI0036419264
MSRHALIALIGTVVIDVLAFAVSFAHLHDLAERSNVAIPAAWPLIVDLLIVVCTVAIVSDRGRLYAWILLMAGAAVSIAGNVADAILPPGPSPVAVTAAVSVVPPLALLAVTHLTVLLARRTPEHVCAEPTAAPDPFGEMTFEPVQQQWSQPPASPVTQYDAPRVTGDAPAEPVTRAAGWINDSLPTFGGYVERAAEWVDPVDTAEQFRTDTDADDDAPGEESARDIAEQLIRNPALSNRQIAGQVGVSEATIRRWRKTVETPA